MAKKKVYLIRAAQFYKIGISYDPIKRLSEIQTGCPIKCIYIGYMPSRFPKDLEKELHLKFQDFQTHGEWFDLGDDSITHLVEEYNLKYVTNPFPEITQESDSVVVSDELRQARRITTMTLAAKTIIEEHFNVIVDPTNLKSIRMFTSKYGYDLVVRAIEHLMGEVDDYQTLCSRMRSTCLSLFRYGRPTNRKVWYVYMNTLPIHGKHVASRIMDFMMINNYEEDRRFFKFILRVIESDMDIDDALTIYKDHLDQE